MCINHLPDWGKNLPPPREGRDERDKKSRIGGGNGGAHIRPAREIYDEEASASRAILR